MGMRPEATSWPPARRAAEANGAAHLFSQTITPAVVPLSIDSARWMTSSAARISAISVSRCAQLVGHLEVVDLERLDGSVVGLLQDQQVEQPNGALVAEGGQLGRHLPREVLRSAGNSTTR